MMERKAACHCGKVQFTARFEDDILRPVRCNCSICAMKGAAMVYVPLAALKVTAGKDALSCYSFNTGVAKHYFCANCGIHCFHQPRSDPSLYAINACTLEGVRPYDDFARVPVNNGQRHVKDFGVATLAGTLQFEPSENDS